MLVRVSPAARSCASTASAAASGGPSEVHRRVAAALSEAVMACARSACCAAWPPASMTAIAIGTFAVDQAEPPRSAPTRSTGRPTPDAGDGEAALAAERGGEPLEAGTVLRREDRVGFAGGRLRGFGRRLGLLGGKRLRRLLLGDRRRRDRLGDDVALGRRVGRFVAAAAREQAGDDECDECGPQRQNVTEALLPPEQVVPLPDGRHDIV